MARLMEFDQAGKTLLGTRYFIYELLRKSHNKRLNSEAISLVNKPCNTTKRNLRDNGLVRTKLRLLYYLPVNNQRSRPIMLQACAVLCNIVYVCDEPSIAQCTRDSTEALNITQHVQKRESKLYHEVKRTVILFWNLSTHV